MQRKSSYSTRRFLGCEIAKAVGDIITYTYCKSLAERICTLASSDNVSYPIKTFTPGYAEHPTIPRTQIEIVASKTDKIHQLTKRNVDFMSANSIEGMVSASQAAVFVNNVRDRGISGMKFILEGCK